MFTVPAGFTNAVLKRELTACAAIVRHVGCARANQGSNWLTWMLMGLAILIPMVAIGFGAPWASAVGLGVGIPGAVVVALWWMLLVTSVVQQNGVQARLVPRLLRRSMAVLASTFIAAVVAITALFWLAGAPAAYVAVSAALGLLAICACLIAPHVCLAVMAGVCAPSLLGLDVYPSSPDMLLAGAALLCLFIGAVVRRALGRGVPVWAPAVAGAMKGREMRVVERAYGRDLQGACARGERGALLLHCLGPRAHARPLVAFVVPLAIGVLAAVAVSTGPESMRTMLTLVFPMAVIGGQLAAGRGMLAAVSAGRREQALFMLAACRPESQSVNRLLARGLLWQYVRSWLASVALVLIFSAAVGGDAVRLSGMFAACVAALAFGPFLLRDHARADAGKAVMGVLVLLALCAGAVVILAVLWQPGAFTWGACAAAGMAGVLMLGWVRWRAMLRAPAAFPAARLD